MTNIHPTAIISKDVSIGEGVFIGPYSVLEGKGEISDGCIIGPHTYLTGWYKIGSKTQIHSGVSIGEPPQDYSFDGAPGLIEIGSGCRIREGASIHTPVHGDQGEKTSVGDNTFLMANSHLGHNDKVGSNCILTNGCLLAGYVTVEDFAILSGNVVVHQMCRVGAYSMTGGVAKVVQDIPPFSLCDGNPAMMHGLNVVGLRRRGINQQQRSIIKNAYRILYSGAGMKDALAEMEEKYGDDETVRHLIDFVRGSKRGIVSSAHVE